MEPRLARLQVDHGRLMDLTYRRPFVDITETRGDPPDLYLLNITCRGVERLDESGDSVYRDSHLVEIFLGAQYPLTGPTIWYCSLSVFHPKISAHGLIS